MPYRMFIEKWYFVVNRSHYVDPSTGEEKVSNKPYLTERAKRPCPGPTGFR